jgi:hypothetical protein
MGEKLLYRTHLRRPRERAAGGVAKRVDLRDDVRERGRLTS